MIYIINPISGGHKVDDDDEGDNQRFVWDFFMLFTNVLGVPYVLAWYMINNL